MLVFVTSASTYVRTYVRNLVGWKPGLSMCTQQGLSMQGLSKVGWKPGLVGQQIIRKCATGRLAAAILVLFVVM